MSDGIWIIGRQTEKDYGPTALITCPNCHNQTYYHLVYIKKWVEYFWIKIFPYKRRYYLLCEICSRGVELKGQQVDAAKKLNEATLSLLDQSITTSQYEMALNEVRNEVETALEYLSS
ncbi:MAG: hypothetical protein QOC96_3295 [Acidobacteriota bacterium]|jgi:hypothetical protein|nr:hypothetical protein [Acidobacteriota bacterium]